MNPWILLGGSIALEIAATSLLKASEGFARPGFGIASIALYSACFWLLSITLTRVPMGIAYAVWSGVGIVAIALIGLAFFRQPMNGAQWLCVGLILVGAVGLNLTTPHDAGSADQRVGTGSGPE
ncbi:MULTISPECIES: DMT family transporter [Sphingomonadales]|uniref:Multidrug transporter EmrE n=1 Tax=Edaphosphingomonas haloaromaticamans TaxID=653954 RepID=A0A1S1HL25_9SPHN|nr:MULTISPECIES: multidrug efflux SMR transporter [Sphingomonas]AGH49506.1 small multidrug resistance protein [Sphingomonas sp. MM-1]OHT22096.1 Multidrug transporter EmrE [Sphingomonas haloaromaticamans]